MKFILLAMTMMGSATYAMMNTFDQARAASNDVIALYTAAGNIDYSASPRKRMEQQEQLFEIADRVTPFAQEYGNAKDPEKLAGKARN